MQRDVPSRREFLRTSAGVATAACAGMAAAAQSEDTSGDVESNAGVLFKSVKWDMVQVPDSVLGKFQLQKSLGFDGVELSSPAKVDRQEFLDASHQTGLPIHGVVDSAHWVERLSSPNPRTRQLGRQALEMALRDTRFYGGSAVLLVPGKVSGAAENHDDVWQRSIDEIRPVLPLAAQLGVRVLIENVWNGFCETPEKFRDFVDEFDNPWVGVYFDIGNVRKFGPSETWIRILGPRIVKLDVKDWSQDKGFCKIGDGDVDWPAVRQALGEIGFTGWCTAEVSGGDRERLTDIAQRMNAHLAI